jgi:hypothetical protein
MRYIFKCNLCQACFASIKGDDFPAFRNRIFVHHLLAHQTQAVRDKLFIWYTPKGEWQQLPSED